MLIPFVSGEDLTAARLTAAFDATARTAFQLVDAPAVNNSTVLVSSTYLTIPVEANSSYVFEAHIIFTTTSTADFKNSLLPPSLSTGLVVPWGSDTAAASVSATIAHSASTILTWATGGLGTGTLFASAPKGFIDTDIAAGNCVFQFAQQNAEASNTILKAGSWLRLTKVA